MTMSIPCEARVMPDDSYQKQCSKCGQWKPATFEFFTPNKHGLLGLRPDCKSCRRTLTDEERQCRHLRLEKMLKPETIERRILAQKGLKRCCTCRQIFPADHEHFSANNKRRNGLGSRCHKCNRRSTADYMHTHPEFVKRMNAKRHERLIKDGRSYSDKDVKRQYKSQKGKCWWCGKPVYLDFHVDHRVSVATGGTNDAGNIVISCPGCNSSKHDKMPHEFNGRLL